MKSKGNFFSRIFLLLTKHLTYHKNLINYLIKICGWLEINNLHLWTFSDYSHFSKQKNYSRFFSQSLLLSASIYSCFRIINNNFYTYTQFRLSQPLAINHFKKFLPINQSCFVSQLIKQDIYLFDYNLQITSRLLSQEWCRNWPKKDAKSFASSYSENKKIIFNGFLKLIASFKAWKLVNSIDKWTLLWIACHQLKNDLRKWGKWESLVERSDQFAVARFVSCKQ